MRKEIWDKIEQSGLDTLDILTEDGFVYFDFIYVEPEPGEKHLHNIYACHRSYMASIKSEPDFWAFEELNNYFDK